MARDFFMEKVSFKEAPDKDERKCHVDVLGKNLLSRGNVGLRRSEAEECLACSGKSREVCVRGKEVRGPEFTGPCRLW